jgi:flagellar motor switch protein FliM
MASTDTDAAGSDVLSQSEVERLLQQVQAEETNAVVHQTDGSKRQQNRESISAYDFRTPVFLSPIELRKLRIHHEEFIQALAARLSIYLRVEFSMQMSQLHTIPFQKWCESLNSPTHLSLFRIEPMRGICLIDLPPRLGLTVVDRLLGGPGHSISGNRDLSELEVTLLDQVISLMITEWCNHWAKYRDLRPAMFGHESNGRFLQTADSDAIMLVLAIEAQMGDCLETIQIAFPYTTIDPLVRQLSTRLKPGTEDMPEVAPKEGDRWNHHFDDAPIEVSAEWNGLKLLARDVASLKVGDVIPLPAEFATSVLMKLESQKRFVGRLGTQDGRWAVEISEQCVPGAKSSSTP